MLVGAAFAGMRWIYAPGYQLAKAGAMLLDLLASGVEQQAWEFAAPGSVRDQSPLMGPVASNGAGVLACILRPRLACQPAIRRLLR